LARDFRQAAPAHDIHRDRDDEDGENRPAGVYLRRCDREPAYSLDYDEGGKREKEARLGQRGERFELAMAVMVLLVGRLAGDPHREISEDRCAGIEQGMARLRQKRE